MEGLPEDPVYRKTIVPGYWAAVRELLRGARMAGKAEHNPMQVRRYPETATYPGYTGSTDAACLLPGGVRPANRKDHQSVMPRVLSV